MNWTNYTNVGNTVELWGLGNNLTSGVMTPAILFAILIAGLVATRNNKTGIALTSLLVYVLSLITVAMGVMNAELTNLFLAIFVISGIYAVN